MITKSGLHYTMCTNCNADDYIIHSLLYTCKIILAPTTNHHNILTHVLIWASPLFLLKDIFESGLVFVCFADYQTSPY